MKKLIFIILFITCSLVAVAQNACSSCQGYGKLRCGSCGGNGVVYQQVWNPYYGTFQAVPYRCAACNGYGALICSNCGGKGYVPSPSFQGKSFVKTNAKCKKCSCSGYWGYYHSNGTYEGNCSNTDQWGHSCGHGPEAHGLRKW